MCGANKALGDGGALVMYLNSAAAYCPLNYPGLVVC